MGSPAMHSRAAQPVLRRGPALVEDQGAWTMRIARTDSAIVFDEFTFGAQDRERRFPRRTQLLRNARRRRNLTSQVARSSGLRCRSLVGCDSGGDE